MTNMFKTIALLTFFVVASVAQEVTPESIPLRELREQCREQKPLICVLSPANGSTVSGKILFRAVFRNRAGEPRCFVRINARVSGLTGRKHGMHIHQYGDISNSSGASAGPHFGNPEGTFVEHGFPKDEIRHWGDFGNLRAVDGAARYNRVDKVITLPGILGRGMIVHAGRDMGPSAQPSGGSGPRIGQCVIGFASPSSIEEVLG